MLKLLPYPFVDGNYALFVLTDISNEVIFLLPIYSTIIPCCTSTQYIDRVLQEAKENKSVNECMFWLADDFFTAPRRIKNGEHTGVETGTKPPIDKDWQSPFKGKMVQDAAAFLKLKPDGAYVDLHHFAVIDEEFEKSRLLKIYKRGDEYLEGDELDFVLCSVQGSMMLLLAMEPHYWEEMKCNHVDGAVM